MTQNLEASSRQSATSDVMRDWQAPLIVALLRVTAVAGLPLMALGGWDALQQGIPALVLLYGFTYVAVLGAAFVPRVSYRLQVGIFAFLLYVLGFSDTLVYGWSAGGRLLLITVPVFIAVFLSQQETLISYLAVSLTVAVSAVLIALGVVAPDVTAPPVSTLASEAALFVVLSGLVVYTLSTLVPRLSASLEQTHTLVQELSQERTVLEQRAQALQQVNYVLQRRAMELEASAEVARAISSIFDVDQLLNQTVRVITENFGFYHTGIFLVDESGDWAVLRAASSEGGRKMLAAGHRLARGEGMVGWVVEHRRSRIALDVGKDAVHFVNPNLPATRSEMALPLLAGGQLLGVLDVQSTEAEAFDQDDIQILEIVAGQLAVAIENARRVSQEATLLEATSPFYRLSRRIATTRSVQEVYRLILETVRDYIPQRALIVEFDRASGQGVLVAELQAGQAVFPTEGSSALRDLLPQDLLAFSVRTLAPLLIDDLANPPELLDVDEVRMLRNLQMLDMQSLALIPVWTEARRLVQLFLIYGARHEFSAAEERLYRAMADLAGVALERIALVQESMRRAAQERWVRELSDRLMGLQDFSQIMSEAAQTLRQIAGAEGILVELAIASSEPREEGKTS